jgi:hypothetical protein
MSDVWQILRAGGVPLASPAASCRPDAPELASSALAAIADSPDGRSSEALAAWLVAWRDHWPARFRSAFAEHGDAVSAWAEAHALDPDRRIKLRRISLANLASIL